MRIRRTRHVHGETIIIWSDEQTMSIPTELRYLESESAVKDRMHALTGRRPSAAQGAYVACCLSHGRLYWEAAESAPMETKPLLLYYGATSFAKALIVGKTGCQIGEIATGHGIACAPGPGDIVASFSVRANGRGLFQQFNDVVSWLNRLHYFEDYNSRHHYIASAPAAAIPNLETDISRILARVPDIASTFALCVGRPASILEIQFDTPHSADRPYEVRVDLPETFEGIEGLRAHVASIRERAPFLNAWRFGRASHAWNNSIVQFFNRAGALELREFEDLIEEDNGKSFSTREPAVWGEPTFNAFEHLPPLSGGYGGRVAFIRDLDGQVLAEHSILLLGLLGLSSLVRYQPHVWTSSVHRRRFGDRPIDDQLIPVIEAFLARSTEAFPRLVSDVLLNR